ncbi:MAG: hypothetical protein EOP93_09805 [Lysobacteraceae bacterium]|nr:MAG: hypothetical protein EOP93_09805 [Xanthomonadaceae bacterium]
MIEENKNLSNAVVENMTQEEKDDSLHKVIQQGAYEAASDLLERGAKYNFAKIDRPSSVFHALWLLPGYYCHNRM